MKYYCIGIKGSGMSTLAQMLKDMGNEVIGYDDAKDYKFTQKGLEDRKIPIYYTNNHELDKDIIVTYSKAFNEEHKEIKRVKELGLTIKPYNEIMGEITKKFQTIGVSGTHGKTTTTTLIKHILGKTIGCNYFIGDGNGHIDPRNDILVMESDEFNRHFLAYHPMIAVVTCIELEHTEIYRDLEDTIQTFQTFVNKANKIVANGDDENIRKIAFEKEVIFYGEKEENDYQIKNISLKTTGSTFDLYHKGGLIGHFEVPLYGKHMVLNTAASIIVNILLNVPIEEIKELLPSFKNAARRFAEEKIGNTVIIDDYAHHPTEIKVTLEAVKQKYPEEKITVVFRPNTYSRTAAFTKEFADALSIADQAYITPILCDRENKNDYKGISSENILELMEHGSLIDEETIEKLQDNKEGVICFMGCATVAHLIEEFKYRVLNIN